MMRVFFLLSVCLYIGPLGTKAAAGAEESIEFQADIEYGQAAGESLKLSLARPKERGGPLPAILFVHGGAWSGGKRDLHDHDIRTAAGLGYLAVTIDYRLAPAHHFPAQIEDCKCAVRWLRAHATQWSIDPGRIGAVGSSAGAHLAMLLGAMDRADGLEGEGGWPDQSSKVQAVVSFAGPTNLQAKYPDVSRRIIENFLGGTLAAKQAAARAASPITYVNSGDAPMLLFQGSKDELVPVEQAFDMTSALAKAGVPGRVEILLGAPHGWGNPDMERTMTAAFAFLDQHLRPGK